MGCSVVVVGFNSRAYLALCVESILAQLTDEDELIVVDNGSQDGSAAFVRAAYPDVRVLEGANVGYAGGNNRGAAVACGDTLVFLNPDTVLQPGALEALVAPLLAGGEVALTTACVVHQDRPELVNTCGNTIHYTGITYCRGADRPRSEQLCGCEVDAVSGAAFAIRRAVFMELGGFDEQLFMYVEDTDLSLRARLAGYRCRYVPEAVVAHDYRMGFSPRKAYYLDRNRHIMLLKNLSMATYARLLPGLLLAELMTAAFFGLRGPRYWGVKLRVYGWLWTHRRALRAQREAQLARRRVPERAVLGQLTHRFDLGVLVGGTVARLAERLLHPAFWAARRLGAV